MKFEMPQYCGNSPRMQVVADFARAWGEADEGFFGTWFVGEPSWEPAAKEEGSSAVIQALPLRGDLAELQVLAVVTHGKYGAVDGTARTESGERFRFAHVLEFTSAAKSGKVAAVRTYIDPEA